MNVIMRPSALFRLGLSLIILAIHIQSGWARDNSSLVPRTSTIAPGPNVQFELQARLIDAVPGDVIQLKAGRYNLLKQLDVVTSKLTIRGEGSGKTVLSFKGQDSGGAGLNATGDNFTLESLAIEDTAGNAVKVLGADGVTLRDVRVEWTGPPRSSNGAYGLYPVQCQNVLIEECVAIGASDAGLYVGQCRNVIVRRSKAERNVAGIEIENSVNADVYENTAVNNTGGLLVFDLPGLQLKSGKNVRLFKNTVKDNNHKNFAAKGAMVASVPPGTGVMIMATDEVEVFDNEIHDHQTGGIAVLSFAITGKKINDATYDQFPESISIHDNRISNSGYDGRGELGLLLKPLLGGKLPDVLWDGVIDPKNQQDGKPTPQQIPSIVNNGKISFANFDFSNLAPQNVLLGKYKVRRDLNEHADVRKPLAAAVLSKPKPTPASATAAVLVYRSAKQKLSEYGLFEGDLAKQTPAKGVVPYELNTPLFSDYTTKYRFIRVPTGETIDYRDEGVLQFPVGTIIAKTFAYPHDMTDPSKGERLLETRIEMHRDEGWFGFSYLWDEQQTDATLVLGGAELDVTWKHTDGSQRSNQYQIPNANQCVTCHDLGDKFVPIGPVAANLNRSFDFGDGPENQLTHLKEQGMLTGTPEDLSAIHAWPEFNLPTSSDSHSNSVDDRARTWLHVNCAHCHSPGGTARTSGLDLRVSQTDAGKWGVWKTPVAAGHGTGGRSYDIVPGKPNESILLHRIESTDPSITMPSVAKRLVPVEAVSLIRQWIAGMEVEQN